MYFNLIESELYQTVSFFVGAILFCLLIIMIFIIMINKRNNIPVNVLYYHNVMII